MTWSFHNPVRVRFGLDAFERIGAVLRGRRYVLVTYAEPPFLLLSQRMSALAGPPLTVIDGIEPNPGVELLQALCARLADLPVMPEVIVALGGGSVMDAAKVLAAGRGLWGPVWATLNGDTIARPPALPIVAIPTTSGTGSEVTSWATVWDPARGRKLSLAAEDLYPETVLVDPRLVMGLPWTTTLASGLDALSHALESLWNINANPVTRELAIGAARDIMRGLGRLQFDLADVDGRTTMASGALRAGLAFSQTRTALAHNISYPITLAHGLAHGIACSFCLPDTMVAAIGVDADCDAALQAVFGDLSTAPETLRRFLRGLGVDSDPRAHGIGAQEWRDIVGAAFAGERGRNFIGRIERFPFPDPAIATTPDRRIPS